jgi:hypothetical protein
VAKKASRTTEKVYEYKYIKEAYRDGIKRKGDKTWMGYMKHG